MRITEYAMTKILLSILLDFTWSESDPLRYLHLATGLLTVSVLTFLLILHSTSLLPLLSLLLTPPLLALLPPLTLLVLPFLTPQHPLPCLLFTLALV